MLLNLWGPLPRWYILFLRLLVHRENTSCMQEKRNQHAETASQCVLLGSGVCHVGRGSRTNLAKTLNCGAKYIFFGVFSSS